MVQKLELADGEVQEAGTVGMMDQVRTLASLSMHPQ